MSADSWGAIYHELQVALVNSLADRVAVGRQRVEQLKGMPVKVGVGFILAMKMLIGETDFSSEANVSSTELLLPRAVETFADFESITGKPHLKGLVYRNVRLVSSQGSARLVPLTVSLDYVRGAGKYGKRQVVMTYSSWEIRVGATMVSVELGSGDLQWFVPQWVDTVNAAKRVIREWPGEHRAHLHPLLVAWSNSPTVTPIARVNVPPTVTDPTTGQETPNPAPFAGELVAPKSVDV